MQSLVTGDCLTAALPERAALVYADPPYGRGSRREGKKAAYDDRLTGSDYNAWLIERLDRVFGLVETGWLCLHHCPELHPAVLAHLWTRYGEPEGEVIWQDAWVSGFRSKSSFWPKVHDVLRFWRVGDPPFEVTGGPAPEGYERRGGGGGGFRADPSVWIGPWSPGHLSFSKEKVGYPDQKPVELLERIIKATTREGDLVVDPFCGSGTALVAAQNLGRSGYGIDVSIDAIEIAEGRLTGTRSG